MRGVTEAGWGLALGVSMAAHVAMVLVPTGQSAESSSVPSIAAPPTEVDLDAVRPDDPASDEPVPTRVEPPNGVEQAPRRADVRSPPRHLAPSAKVQPVDPVPTAEVPLLAATAGDLPHFMVSLARSATLAERAVDVPARLSRGEPPTYPARARADGLEADVLVELVVSRLGDVESARVAQPVGHGLDEAAVAAARTFRFTPAMKEGRPVPVRVSWTMQFRLR